MKQRGVEQKGKRTMGFKARVLGGWIGERMLRSAVVEATESLGTSFRRLSLGAPWLRGVKVGAGDKVQIFLPEVGTRSFTPFDHDMVFGRFSIVAHLHAATPGARWAREVQPGTTVRLKGPDSSTPLASLPSPVRLFGDETSLAVARSLLALRPDGAGCLVRLEVGSVDEVSAAAHSLGLPATSLVSKQEGDRHLRAIVQEFVGPSNAEGGSVVLTGRARSIQKVRALLRASGAKPEQRVKAYWADGKSGLD